MMIRCSLSGIFTKSPLQRACRSIECISFDSRRSLASTPQKAPLEHVGKKAFKRDRPHVNVGTIGHFNHGKSTLTKAITKVLSGNDSCPSTMDVEKTVTVENVNYFTEKRTYEHSDCPGWKDYTKNMISRAYQMDGAILVVDANEGSMPQTKEHLILAKQMGVENIVVFVNKADVADQEMFELIELDIRQLLTATGFNGDQAPVVMGSALCALEDRNPKLGVEAINKLLDAMQEYIPTPVRNLDTDFLMQVSRVFGVPGIGTVVKGNVDQGKLLKGQEVELLGYGKMHQTTVTGIEMDLQTLEEAHAGDPVSAVLKGVKRDDAKRGMSLARPGTFKMHDRMEAQVHILDKSEADKDVEPLATSSQCTLFSRTFDTLTELMFEEKELMVPGENGKVTLTFLKPMVVQLGQKFSLRTNARTIGTGIITKILPNQTEHGIPKRRKSKEKDAWNEHVKSLKEAYKAEQEMSGR